MLEEQFEDYLKQQADQYKVSPNESLFDKISAASFEQKLSNAAAGYKVHPDASVWKRISSTLYPSRFKRPVIWWSAAAVILFSIGITGILRINNKHPEINTAQSTEQPSDNQTPESVIAHEEPGINTPAPQKSAENSISTHSIAAPTYTPVPAVASNDNPKPATQDPTYSSPQPEKTFPGEPENVNNLNVPVNKQENQPLKTEEMQQLVPENTVVAEKKDSIKPDELVSKKEKNPEGANSRRSHWDLGAYYTPQYGSWHLYGNKYENSSNYVQARNKTDEADYCYSFGLEAGYFVAHHWRISGGLQYQFFSSRELVRNYYFQDYTLNANAILNPVPSISQNSTNTGEPEYIRNSYQFLQMPLGIEYVTEVINNKWEFAGGLRISPQYLLYSKSLLFRKSTNTYAEFDGNSNIDIHDWNLQASLSIRAQYSIKNRLGIYVAPEFGYALRSNFSENYIVSAHPYTLGLRSGIRIKF